MFRGPQSDLFEYEQAMFDATDQILRQLRAGEDSRAEFKELRYSRRGVVSPRTENLAAEMVAFANAEGGTFIFGVDDSGAPAGVPRDRLDAVEQWIINVASDLCDPPIRPLLRRAVVPGADGEVTVVLAEIPRGVHVHRTAQGRYHVRVGSTKRDLDRTELARLFQERGRGFVFDEQPVHAATADDLQRSLLEAHFELSPTIPWPDLLRNTPGGLPNGITVDAMPYGTFTRNQLLVSFLSRMRSARTGQHYLESRGEGVRKILEGGEAHSGRRPEYELFGNELRLTVWGRAVGTRNVGHSAP